MSEKYFRAIVEFYAIVFLFLNSGCINDSNSELSKEIRVKESELKIKRIKHDIVYGQGDDIGKFDKLNIEKNELKQLKNNSSDGTVGDLFPVLNIFADPRIRKMADAKCELHSKSSIEIRKLEEKKYLLDHQINKY